MSLNGTAVTERLRTYLHRVGTREDPLQRGLRDETAKLSNAEWAISPEQGQLMTLLVEALGARRAIEVGTFTGYSALAIARALPPDGRLICCDISSEWTSVGQRFWEKAGVADKIDLRIGPALDTMDALIAQGASDSFDFAFIDADKRVYDTYYERCLTLVRPGGLIAVDNVLWGGKVADSGERGAATRAIRALNRKLHDDPRVTISMVPIGDGLTLALKRAAA